MSTETKPGALPYGRQWIDEDDLSAVREALTSAYLTTGPKVRDFEETFARRTGARHAVAVSSGTAALHAASAAAGLGPGDEALVPTMSFIATANAVAFTGAAPVFVDMKRDGFNLDLADAEKKITPRTKAIFPVHFAGEPAEMDAVHALAGRHGLTVIEDAAHALGATVGSRPVGGLSHMTCFSFHPVKHITTGEGGMITTNDDALCARLRSFRNHGVDTDAAARDRAGTWYYDMTSLGYNYRISDIQAALGVSQLAKLDRFVERRRAIAALYDKMLSRVPGVIRPSLNEPGKTHSWHLYVIRLAPSFADGARDALFNMLRREGIGVQVHYRPIHLHSFHQKYAGARKASCPVAESAWVRMLSLPIFPAMDDADVERVVDAINRLLPALGKAS